jgi:ectoine hydroxylase-related dioxygenase (phytanoyl-CoA dioxygenase family)
MSKLEITDLKFLENIYNNAFKKRKIKYPSKVQNKIKNIETNDLNNNGYVILKNHYEKSFIDNFYLKFDTLIKDHNNIRRSRDLRSAQNDKDNIYIDKISDEVFKSGLDTIKKYSDNVQLVDSLFKIPDLFKIILDKKILSIANDFFGVLPAFTYIKMVRNFCNKFKEFDTQHFHIDENSSKILKIFIYLNDVDKNGGPFCFVKKSHKNKEKFWGKKPRWTQEEIKEKFRSENIHELTCKRGDVIIANTNGFHRGLKPVTVDRNIIIINYCIHEEYSFNYKKDLKINVPKKIVDKLENENRGIFDLCNII